MPIRELVETGRTCHWMLSASDVSLIRNRIVHNTNEKHGKREALCRNLADTLIVTRSARPEPPVGHVDLICPQETAKGKGSFLKSPCQELAWVRSWGDTSWTQVEGHPTGGKAWTLWQVQQNVKWIQKTSVTYVRWSCILGFSRTWFWTLYPPLRWCVPSRERRGWDKLAE